MKMVGHKSMNRDNQREGHWGTSWIESKGRGTSEKRGTSTRDLGTSNIMQFASLGSRDGGHGNRDQE